MGRDIFLVSSEKTLKIILTLAKYWKYIILSYDIIPISMHNGLF